MIRFACPGCSSTFSVPDEQAGQPGACDKCGVRFLIPTPLTAPIEAPPTLSPVPELPPQLPGTVTSNAPEVRNCPTCEAKISILHEDVGHEVECPACKAIFRVQESKKPKPSSRRQRDDDEDEREEPRSRRSSRSSKREDEEAEDTEDPDSKYRKRSRRKYDEDDGDDYERDEYGYIAKPSEVKTTGVLLIVGGVLACVYFL